MLKQTAVKSGKSHSSENILIYYTLPPPKASHIVGGGANVALGGSKARLAPRRAGNALRVRHSYWHPAVGHAQNVYYRLIVL